MALAGHTEVQRPQTVQALRIGKVRDGSKPGVLAYSQEHAREWATPLVTLEFAECIGACDGARAAAPGLSISVARLARRLSGLLLLIVPGLLRIDVRPLVHAKLGVTS